MGLAGSPPRHRGKLHSLAINNSSVKGSVLKKTDPSYSMPNRLPNFLLMET